MGSVEYGPKQADVFRQDESKGFMENSLYAPKISISLVLGIFTASMQGTVSLRSLHGKFLSAQPDGRAEWNRDIASEWEYFYLEKRQGGKITLKGAHGMYVSAQPDGSVQINRKAAPQGGWEEFTVEDRGNSFVCLKSCHGKYLSALTRWHSTMEPGLCATWRLGRHPVRGAGRYRPRSYTCTRIDRNFGRRTR